MTMVDSILVNKTEPPYQLRANEWAFYYEEAGQAFMQYVRIVCPTSKEQIALIARFISMASSLREYAVNGPEDILPLWDELRKDDKYLDCLMWATASFFQGCSLTVQTLAENMATAIHVIFPSDERMDEWAIADNSFRESLGDPSALRQLFMANPWLMVFVLIKRSGALSLTASPAAPSQPA